MIELKRDALVFRFPEEHAHAELRIDFQRTLRIPDDGTEYPLPAGLGRFPLRHVDDFASRLPASWRRHGGVMLPMYQAEAMWLRFDSPHDYPFAVKVATGKVNAVTGEGWREGLQREPQDYLCVPPQPWLDGYCVERGVIRQFVAMPLGAGYTGEEQLTGRAEHGGLQLAVYPMRREVYEALQRTKPVYLADLFAGILCEEAAASYDMGLAPGGLMRQSIEDDPHGIAAWSTRSSRCFVHLANSFVWREITGEAPPTVPPTAREYERRGLPWFEWYAERSAPRDATAALEGLKSVRQIGSEKGQVPLPENTSIVPGAVIPLRSGLANDQVREGVF